MKKIIEFSSPINLIESQKSVLKSLRTKAIHGPGIYTEKTLAALKKKFNFKKVLLTNSCTSALEIASIVINLKKGDEVLMPSYTFITTGGSFARTKAKIVYCDISRKDLMPSFEDIKSKVTIKTKAIVIVHYQGFCVDYLLELAIFCKKKNIVLVEDAAQAIGTKFKNKYLGTIGDLSCVSFHYTKNIHSGVGGCLAINNSKFIQKSIFAHDKGSNRYLQIQKKIKRYSWVSLGSAFLMSEMHASYLYPQLLHYDQIVKKRKNIYEKYLLNLDFYNDYFYLVKNNSCKKYNYHGLVLILKKDNCEKLTSYLKKNNISAFIGYSPLHLSSYGKKFLKKGRSLTVTDKIYDKILRLPMHTDLTIKDINFVCNKIKNFFKIS